MSGAPTRIAILGGGFGGLYAATYLSAADFPEGSVEVTLVSDTNHFTFTPLLSEVVGGSLGREHVTFPYRMMARRYGFRFLLGRVEGIDPSSGVAETTAGPVPFDHAVLAFGARPRYFANEELERRSLPLTSVAEATAIRDRVLALAERASLERDPIVRRRLLTFAVAGAGPAGVEAASEIWQLLTGVLPRYYSLGDAPRVLIVEANDSILRGWDADLARAGLAALRRRGVEVHLRTLVAGFDGRTVLTKAAEGPGETDSREDAVQTETLIWTAGTAPASAPLADSPLSRKKSGHFSVDVHLRAKGFENVYAVGDVASLVNPRTGRPYPPVAPIAISQGVRAAGNVENAIAGRPPEPYQAHHAGKIVSLGGGVALADLLGFRVTGHPAWAIYRLTYLLKLVGLQNKVRTAATLLLNRVFERDLSCVC
ncbi:MAG: NAD(P)/FAD-dependent oxidoreductase [Gemmatimonadota bacterium]